MLGKSSPFKKFSHHRGNSTEESHSNTFHRKTASAGSQNPPVAGHTRNTSRSSNTSVSSNFLAEQYERDRRAILSSCFEQETLTAPSAASSPAKTYVTHVRIIEDTRYPSARPPLNSPLSNKKKRVLVVSSLTNGGGMHIHKARENNNGSFQIGRTWALKELECIERDTEQHEGFLLTMGKRYYWETNTAKERTVFIKSLVKIYMEDSGGHVPRLVNWDLGLFYLDDNSYRRALISTSNQHTARDSSSLNSNSQALPRQATDQNGTSQPLHAPQAPVKLPALAQQSMLSSGLQAPSGPLLGGEEPQMKTTRTPKTRSNQNFKPSSPSQDPRSTASTTNKAETPPQSLTLSTTSSRSVNDSKSSHSKLSKATYQHIKPSDHTSKERGSPLSLKQETEISFNTTTAPNVEDDKSLTRESTNFLSELNSVLTEPVEIPSFPQLIGANVRDDLDAESLTCSSSGDLDKKESEITDLYQSASSHEADDLLHDLNENPNELSFERGDEVRYSQIIEDTNENESDEPSHPYHDVSTIREEPQGIHVNDAHKVDFSDGQKVLTEINNQALMDTLDSVNWSVDDDSTELMYKLSSKLAETEYKLNKELVALPDNSDEFSSYGQKVISECEKLDPTLSFFAMELSTVSRDIEYVENQSNGLQVESANKKMLWKELSEILSSVSVDEKTLNDLLTLPLSERNLGQVEKLLTSLYTALKAIRGDEEEEELNLGVMRALRERRQAYDKVTGLFMKRVVDELNKKFTSLQHERVPDEQLANALARLLMFSSLVLFSKGISLETYFDIVDKAVQETEVLLRRRTAPLLSNLASHMLSEKTGLSASEFPDQEKQLARWEETRTRKQFIPLEPRNFSTLQDLTSSLQILEALVVTYQNFFGVFFHIGDNLDFEKFISAYPEPNSRITKLKTISLMDSDRESASLKMQLMTRIFQPIFNEFFDEVFVLAKDQASLIPVVLLYLESGIARYSSSDQEYLISTFEKFFSRFSQEWQEYVNVQSQAIERASIDVDAKSVSAYVTGFLTFVAQIEDEINFVHEMLKMTIENCVESREVMDQSYDDLGQSLLILIQKSSQSPVSNTMISPAKSSNSRSESVSLLINCNWMIEILPLLGNEMLFIDCLQSSKSLFNVEKERYAESLLRASMNHLYSFVDGAHTLTEASKTRIVNPSQWAVYSQQNLNKILDRYTPQEIVVAIDNLYNYVKQDILGEKEGIINTILFDKLWSCIQGQTVSLYLKLYTLIERHYKGTSVKFTKNEIISAFNAHKKTN
ncbi:LANO_0H19724g1_1 [Lachancea nothofagi CBS 11611]|uniref:LANO_0H19724g1_1 n=1 Tax=Lachancea nothofagi CBS 11611 TaxID=1266666 RepID=A0A1G4KNE2_9SACH|nr:LANO_0H19724g1_1 [Lachancea nothofagi CBS 11611]